MSGQSGFVRVVYRQLSATADANPINAKTSQGALYAIRGYNASASIRYLKIYNTAATPTSSMTPVETLVLPPMSRFAEEWYGGMRFDTGIAIRMTTAAADNDTGALTAGDVTCLNIEMS